MNPRDHGSPAPVGDGADGAPTTEAATTTAPVRVLVVDDDPQTVGMVRVMLEIRGFEVEAAVDGPRALELLRAWHPDVVLLDVMMPDMSGFEVLDRIREDPQQASLPVILVTSLTTDDDLLQGYRTGADYYITKPFTGPEIVHGICLVLGREMRD